MLSFNLKTLNAAQQWEQHTFAISIPLFSLSLSLYFLFSFFSRKNGQKNKLFWPLREMEVVVGKVNGERKKKWAGEMRRKRGKVEGDVRRERDRENLFIEVPILASCLGWLYNFLITFHIIFSFPIPKPHNSGRENNSPTVKLSPPRWPPPIFRLLCNSFNRYTLFFFPN